MLLRSYNQTKTIKAFLTYEFRNNFIDILGHSLHEKLGSLWCVIKAEKIYLTEIYFNY